ncbi:unnamed protein product [Fraxinus pennsylvanica]|uniref:Uncharacterized protein n=1 Tax=Fraxinus pennsylvanica TaxID=56036 RepID=A0AAD1Z0T2_9LAMI|nr:unnamed protein product [Fraxinus pennsylvanica]
MRKPESGRKNHVEDHKSSAVKYAWSSALDDLMLVKDPRTVSGRKKQVARFPQSWPSEGHKNKKFRKIPGQYSGYIESHVSEILFKVPIEVMVFYILVVYMLEAWRGSSRILVLLVV